MVSGAYAIFAVLRDRLSPAGASAVTAMAFASVTFLLAVFGPKMIRARAVSMIDRDVAGPPKIDSSVMRTGIEVGMAVITTIAEVALQRRRERSHKR